MKFRVFLDHNVSFLSHLRSLPRHYHHQQGLTRLSSSTLDLSSASYDYRKDTLYASKAVALVCSEPLVDAATKVLKSLYRYSAKSDFDLQVRMQASLKCKDLGSES